MPWLLNEDRAIKAKLLGLTVQDVNAPSGRPVKVRFRLPEVELADVDFPMVIIEHAGITKDEEREHRGTIRLGYTPEGLPEVDGGYKTEFPIPYNLDYQISVYSRKAHHDIALRAALAQADRIPARFGYIEIPQDGTVRRLDLIGGPETEAIKDEDGKRTFVQTYMVRVSSELLPSQVAAAARVIEDGVRLDIEYDLTLPGA